MDDFYRLKNTQTQQENEAALRLPVITHVRSPFQHERRLKMCFLYGSRLQVN